MEPLYIQTPLWPSRPLSAALGAPVLLKMEALQPVGSFKARGMGEAVRTAAEAGAKRVICSSGGNAGLAVAYAGRVLGLGVTIVVPRTASERSKELIQAEGAEVIVHGGVWDEAHAYATETAHHSGAVYVHPFDDPVVWRGHASMIHEMAEAGAQPGVVVVAVGGGGLLCGVAEGMRDVGWDSVPILAVETEGAASFARAVEAGELVTLDRITSIATTLGARRVAAEALGWARQRPITPWIVSDRQAVDACLRFVDDHRLLVEPSCGAALAAVYDRAAPLTHGEPVVVIVCGGAGVNRALLATWDEQV